MYCVLVRERKVKSLIWVLSLFSRVIHYLKFIFHKYEISVRVGGKGLQKDANIDKDKKKLNTVAKPFTL